MAASLTTYPTCKLDWRQGASTYRNCTVSCSSRVTSAAVRRSLPGCCCSTMEGQVRISSHPLPGTADEGTRSIRVRDGVHLFITPPEQLSALEHARLGHLCTTWTQAQSGYQLTQRFQTLFKCGGVAEFRVWLTEARQGDIREFKRLARGLSHDQKAVEASLTVPWSSGQAPRGAVLAKTTDRWRDRSTVSN